MTATLTPHPRSQDGRALRAALDAQADRIAELEEQLVAAERDYADLVTATARLRHRLTDWRWIIAVICTHSAVVGFWLGHLLWP